MQQEAPQPGVLLLSSKLLDDSAALTGLDFARWGEDTCVPSIQATGGVWHTLRYESRGFMRRHRSADKPNGQANDRDLWTDEKYQYDFLDVYFLPDVTSTTECDEWRRLPIVGEDSEITGDMDASKLFERLLMLTEFNVRVCAAIDSSSSVASTAAPAPFLVTITTPDGQVPEGIMKAGKVIGRYQLQRSFSVSAMELRGSQPPKHKEVILLACNSLRNFAPPEDDDGITIGVWGLRKQYTGAERTPAAWRPGVRI